MFHHCFWRILFSWRQPWVVAGCQGPEAHTQLSPMAGENQFWVITFKILVKNEWTFFYSLLVGCDTSISAIKTIKTRIFDIFSAILRVFGRFWLIFSCFWGCFANKIFRMCPRATRSRDFHYAGILCIIRVLSMGKKSSFCWIYKLLKLKFAYIVEKWKKSEVLSRNSQHQHL